jgi:UDP-N-acetylmuramate--alanine ligase
LIPRAEALAEIMRLKKGVAVAGTHGKTTTTSLVSSLFLNSQLDPTIVVGGRLDIIQSTSKLGSGEWLIAEADESDGSFLKLSPEIAIVTNIDKDHLDYYTHFNALKKSFFDFACRIPFYGSLVACGDDPVVREVFKGFSKKCLYYGFDSSNDYRLEGSRGAYKVFHKENLLGEIQIPLPGRHNALNALAAVIVGLEAGISFDQCQKGLDSFKGVDRRFQHKACFQGIDYYDDYGHHPTEVMAVMQAFKEKFPHRPLKVLFQPHRYSRTKECWAEFTQAFQGADELYLLDIYPAGEDPIEGIDSKNLAEAILETKTTYLNSQDENRLFETLKSLQEKWQEGDIFLSLGAGSVSRIAEVLLTPSNS